VGGSRRRGQHDRQTDANASLDLGFMHGRNVEDPDGHIRERFYLDMSQRPRA